LSTTTIPLRRRPPSRRRIRHFPDSAGSRVVILAPIGVGVVITAIGIAVMVCILVGGRGSIVARTVMTTTRVGARTLVGVTFAIIVFWHCVEWVWE